MVRTNLPSQAVGGSGVPALDLTQEQQDWLLQRSRAMHEVLKVDFIDDDYRSYIRGLHTGLAISDFKAEFGVEMDASSMRARLMLAAPMADDPEYRSRFLDFFFSAGKTHE